MDLCSAAADLCTPTQEQSKRGHQFSVLGGKPTFKRKKEEKPMGSFSFQIHQLDKQLCASWLAEVERDVYREGNVQVMTNVSS